MANRELILLALDQSPTLSLMERALRAAGHDVTVVRRQAALENVLAESSPSLLLLGETFDGTDGIELGRRQLERFPTLPILLFAEKETLVTIRSALKAGLSGVLTAPLKTDDIVQAVDRALKRASYLGDWLRREVRRTTASLESRTQVSESERGRLETIIAGIEDGVIVLDPAENLVLINLAAREIFGLKEADVTGRPLEVVLSSSDLPASLASPSNRATRLFELNFEDGRVFKAQHTPIPQIGSAVTLHDITEIKRLEKLKGDFVHTVAHDLRSPLTAVLGYAELVEHAGALNENQHDFVNRIQTSVKSITGLVNELLEFGRLESTADTRRENVQLEGIMKDSLSLFEPLILQKKLQMKLETATDLPPVRANPVRMRQLMDNLISNAIKYTPEGGEVQLRLRCDNHQLVFQVKDSGPGIPQEDQAHIFERFYRARNVDGTQGTGLGLTIVKSIADSYNGRVWVESAEGVGSTFFVVLPAQETSSA
jgi:PAS domain S-box-containing protein